MKKMMIMVAAIVALFSLSGCAGSVADLAALPTGEIVSAATDRWGSWERTRLAEEKTKQMLGKALQEQAKEDQGQTKEAVIININSNEQLLTYALHQANDNLARANKDMAKIALALASGGSEYDNLVSTTPMPRGAFSEGMDSFFGGAAKVANTPLAVTLGAGLAAKQLVEAVGATAGDDFNLARGDLNANNSFNNTQQHQTGSDGSTLGQAPYEVRPEVVYPTPPQ